MVRLKKIFCFGRRYKLGINSVCHSWTPV